ncbi:hypothetical protein GOP47_0003457 [Adiantum capillus-veneris]|uniref:Uncharacterized protein n=1 Tax=Adiantum capillus-veneris TaxID=13818 RepID=A0A9D4VCA2_ADICA|nr:hypothetical protein GOP47_0003457 [Adiantum capillus-veneris]
MAPATLRFYPPQRLPPQLNARLASPTVACRDFLPRSRRQFICSSDPHPPQRPANEDAKLRAEVAPSVLRALQSQDATSSSIPSGESLIERNLRKRASTEQAPSSSSPSMEEMSSASDLGDGKFSSDSLLSEKQGSPASRMSSTSSDMSPFPAFGGGEGISGCAMVSSFPITAAFWQETPPGFDLGDFRSLDFYAWFFRVSLLLCANTDFDYLQGLSVPSLLWLVLPSDVFTSFFPKTSEDLYLQSNKGDPGELGKVIDNQDAISLAIEFFSTIWSSKAWTERAKSGKASEFVLALAYSAYVFILSGAAGEASSMAKKLEEYSRRLNQSLTQLHGLPLDPITIWEKALKGTSFALDGSAFVYDHALIFPCKLKPTERRAQFGPMLEEVQNCLNKEFKDSGLLVFLHRSSDNEEEFFILIAPWYWALTVDSKQIAPFPAVLCILSCVATSQFSGAGFDFGFCWEQYVVPLGWAGIVASLYFVNDMRFPTLCPFPSLGSTGKFSSDYGLVSSRSSLISAVLKSSCAPLAVSLLLLVCGFTFWGPSHYNMATVVDFRGYVLVSPDLFSYSAVLTELLQNASVATIQGEDGGAKLAASPFVLAGLLGLNFTAFTLVPGMRTDGGHLVRSLLKSRTLANQLNFVLMMLLTLILCGKNPFLGLGWLAVSYFTEAVCFVKDDVSDTDFVPSLAGAVLVAASLACFVPPMP